MRDMVVKSGRAASFIALATLLWAQAGNAEVVDRVVAVVNDSVITLSELNAASTLGNDALMAEKKPKKVMEQKSRVLDSLIEQKLVKQAAEKAGIEVSEKEIDNAVEDVRKQNNVSLDELIVAVTRSGLTYKEYRDILREDIREIKFVSRQFRSRISVNDDDVVEYYAQNSDKFMSPPATRLRLIFFSNADKETMDKRMDAFNQGIAAGEDFADLARELSEGPASADGGDLGYTKEGELSAPIEEAARKLRPGEISGHIETLEGISIIQLIERKETGVRPLEEVKKTIQDTLFKKTVDERYRQWLEDTKKTAHIKVLL